MGRYFFEKIVDFSPTFTFLKRYSYIEGQKIPHSPFSAPWQPNIRITGYIQLTLPQPKERFGRCVPVLTRGYRRNGGGAPPEAGEVAWNTYLKRRVSNHDTHRGDALKASAVLPTMWYRKWELFPTAGSVVRPYIREVVSNRVYHLIPDYGGHKFSTSDRHACGSKSANFQKRGVLYKQQTI